MRPLALALVPVLLAAGCLGAEETPPEACAGSCAEDAPLSPPGCAGCEPAAAGGVHAPNLTAGTAWTYRSAQVYNPDEEFTVVVARADADGYLFAGAAEDDVAFAAAWGSVWFGPMGRDLNREEYGLSLFRWPLVDGLEWAFYEGFPLKARVADVRTPGGTEPGFVVEGQSEHARLRYEYAPAVGYVTSWRFEVRDRVMEELELVRVGSAREYVWLERGEQVSVHDPAAPRAFDVETGWDSVVVSAGGVNDARVALALPDGSTWTQAYPGDPGFEGTWTLDVFPAQAGRWAASAQNAGPLREVPVDAERPMAWSYIQLAPVTWVRGAVGS